jgi:signal transduction histidine kinase
MTKNHPLGADAGDQARPEPPDTDGLPGTPLLAKLGHELRGPLTGILGLSQIMLVKLAAGPPEPKQQARQLELMRDSAEQSLRTVDRLVEVTRLDLAAAAPAPESRDCRAGIAAAVTRARPTADAHGRTLILDLPDEPVMLADRDNAIDRILAELLDNAVKYTDHPEIRVSAHRGRDRGPTIEISDDGPGMTEPEQSRIGNPFERGAAAGDADVPGSGLGLYLARCLADRAGLQVVVRSAPAAGTTVAVRADPASGAAATQHRRAELRADPASGPAVTQHRRAER